MKPSFGGLTPQQIERKTLLMWVRQSAKDTLVVAAKGGFDQLFFENNRQCKRACALLGVTPAVAFRYATHTNNFYKRMRDEWLDGRS